MEKEYSEHLFNHAPTCQALLKALQRELAALPGEGALCFMEVCGTHTAALLRSGLSSLLPGRLRHISGPGCPVCVTHQQDIEACLKLTERDDILLAAFGDLLRVPGTDGRSLEEAGKNLRIIYSPLESVRLAAENPDKTVVLAGIGFETTAPATAVAVLRAVEQKLGNWRILSMHKLVIPALRAILEDLESPVQAFLLPGHVSSIIGLYPYAFIAEEFHKPAVIAGFEPMDLITALIHIVSMLRRNQPAIVNDYQRVVAWQGNPRAMEIMYRVFEPAPALWRGLGMIPQSGLKLRGELSALAADIEYDGMAGSAVELAACRCGDILRGKITPAQCPAFARACTPQNPLGPCMVSSEGACGLSYAYDYQEQG